MHLGSLCLIRSSCFVVCLFAHTIVVTLKTQSVALFLMRD